MSQQLAYRSKKRRKSLCEPKQLNTCFTLTEVLGVGRKQTLIWLQLAQTLGSLGRLQQLGELKVLYSIE